MLSVFSASFGVLHKHSLGHLLLTLEPVDIIAVKFTNTFYNSKTHLHAHTADIIHVAQAIAEVRTITVHIISSRDRSFPLWLVSLSSPNSPDPEPDIDVPLTPLIEELKGTIIECRK